MKKNLAPRKMCFALHSIRQMLNGQDPIVLFLTDLFVLKNYYLP